MGEQERRIAVKRVIEENPGIYREKLSREINKDPSKSMEKKTLDKILGLLQDDGEITRDDKKLYYSMDGRLDKLFAVKKCELREKIRQIKGEFPRYDFHVFDEMLEELFAQTKNDLSEEMHKKINNIIKQAEKDFSSYGYGKQRFLIGCITDRLYS